MSGKNPPRLRRRLPEPALSCPQDDKRRRRRHRQGCMRHSALPQLQPAKTPPEGASRSLQFSSASQPLFGASVSRAAAHQVPGRATCRHTTAPVCRLRVRPPRPIFSTLTTTAAAVDRPPKYSPVFFFFSFCHTAPPAPPRLERCCLRAATMTTGFAASFWSSDYAGGTS